MGITIHYKLGAYKTTVKDILDNTEKLASFIKKEADKAGIDFTFDRISDYYLIINTQGCETLSFDFRTPKEIKSYFNYLSAKDLEWCNDQGYNIAEYPKNEKLYCSNFCKTQFSRATCHKWIADLVRLTASRCFYADIYDEGNYYYTNKIEDAKQAIDQFL